MPQSVDKAIQLAPDMHDVQYAKPVHPAVPRIVAGEIELQDLGIAASVIRDALGKPSDYSSSPDEDQTEDGGEKTAEKENSDEDAREEDSDASGEDS